MEVSCTFNCLIPARRTNEDSFIPCRASSSIGTADALKTDFDFAEIN